MASGAYASDALANMLKQRDWDHLRQSWLRHVPAIDPAGSIPKITFSGFSKENTLFDAEAIRKNKGRVTATTTPLAEVPGILLREAIMWLHKSLHVLGGVEVHAERGLLTWSIAEAYQSSFFACRSIMGFLGVSLFDFENNITVLLDIGRDTRGLAKAKFDRISAFADQAAFGTLATRLDQVDVWNCFQRILRVSRIGCWPEGWAKFFEGVPIKVLTRQRHELHYHACSWLFGDLHEYLSRELLTGSMRMHIQWEEFTIDCENFSLRIALALNALALRLFGDLASVTNRLRPELDLVAGKFTSDRHPAFATVLRGCLPVVDQRAI